MLKDMTLGQYYQTESVIHKLDPRVKLVEHCCILFPVYF